MQGLLYTQFKYSTHTISATSLKSNFLNSWNSDVRALLSISWIKGHKKARFG